MTKLNKAKPGDIVVLERLPPGLLKGLPEEDQIAISEIVGKPVLMVCYDDDGRAELEFADRNGHRHSIFRGPWLYSEKQRQLTQTDRPQPATG